LSASQKLQARNAPSCPWQPVDAGFRRVPEHESVAQESFLDRGYRADHPWIPGGQKPEVGDDQHARVERVTAVRLRERADLGIEAALAHLGADSLAERRQVRQHPAPLLATATLLIDPAY